VTFCQVLLTRCQFFKLPDFGARREPIRSLEPSTNRLESAPMSRKICRLRSLDLVFYSQISARVQIASRVYRVTD
jgi:hypothetical protein